MGQASGWQFALRHLRVIALVVFLVLMGASLAEVPSEIRSSDPGCCVR
jgi:hypothetical protein